LEIGKSDLFNVLDDSFSIEIKVLIKGNLLDVDFFKVFDREFVFCCFYVTQINIFI
jgi:hypothetical protein